jgi:branched-chain amino acid transport system substrate-binding protein
MSLKSTIARTLCAAIALLPLGAGAQAQLPPLKIGMVYSFTGAGTYSLTPDVAIAAFLKTHGDMVAGRRVVIVRRDDTGPKPDVARRLAQELIVQENVDVLIGGAYTPTGAAIAAVSTEAKKPFFLINAATSNVIAKQPYSSRWGFTEAQSTTPLAQWALRTGVKRVYSLVSDYGPGLDAEKTFAETFTAGGGTMVGSVRVPINNGDFSSYILRIADAKPDAVFTFTDVSGTIFLKAFNDAGLAKSGVKLLTTADLATENNFATAGESVIGVVSSYNYTPSHPSKLNAAFVKAFQDADTSGKLLPDFMAISTWDIMTAIYKIATTLKGNLDPDKTMELVRGMSFESPRGPIQIDPATRAVVENFYLRRVEKRDGKLVNVEFATIPMVHDPNER